MSMRNCTVAKQDANSTPFPEKLTVSVALIHFSGIPSPLSPLLNPSVAYTVMHASLQCFVAICWMTDL